MVAYGSAQCTTQQPPMGLPGSSGHVKGVHLAGRHAPARMFKVIETMK